MTTTSEASTLESSAGQVGATDKLQPKGHPLIPLFFIALLIIGYVVPLAIKNGASGFLGIILGTLSYCTTPESLLVLAALGTWFWIAQRKILFAQTLGETLKRSFWPIIVMCLFLVAVACVTIHPALESQAIARRQNLLASGVNTDALKGWEVMKRDHQLGNTASGLTPAAKKRMREMTALQWKGSLAAFTNLNVELQGDDHDKLVFSFSNVEPTIATNLPRLLQKADNDFWNRMRFFNFKEVIFAGNNYYESILESKFSQWSNGYEAYISNTVAVYDGTGGQPQLFVGGGKELNPAVQKSMRQNLASGLNGGLKSVYKSIEVRLEGENEDTLILHQREMNAATADNWVKALGKDKAGNFWNGLRAFAFRELVLSGENYQRSIPRKEFIQWCHDYEKYLSEMRKAAGQISGAMKYEATVP